MLRNTILYVVIDFFFFHCFSPLFPNSLARFKVASRPTTDSSYLSHSTSGIDNKREAEHRDCVESKFGRTVGKSVSHRVAFELEKFPEKKQLSNADRSANFDSFFLFAGGEISAAQEEALCIRTHG